MIITQKDKNYLHKLLDNVCFPEQFGIDESGVLDSNYDILSSINGTANIRSLYGASKYVLLEKNLPYVIKIPFNGCWFYDEEGDPEIDEDTVFCPFENACNDGYADDFFFADDYCETERRFYQVMIETGFEVFFAETRYFDTINGKRIYLQEKVTPYESFSDRQEASPLAKQFSEILNVSLPADWIEKAIESYGEELTKAFVDFLSSDKDVGAIIASDLYSANYGYREDGTPCLLDYSGYEA